MKSENKEIQEFLKNLKKDNEDKAYKKDHFMKEFLGIDELK